MMQVAETLKAKLKTLPAKPGCYLMKDAEGRIIYVGKAVNLRARVRSYFQATAGVSPKTGHLVMQITDLDWIVAPSELEALILENNLIKRHKPRYNVRLKDDKTYPYIKIHWQDAYPKITITRRMEQDGARYYGPFTSAWAVQQTLDVLRRIFPYLTCDREITGKDPRPCLYFHIGRCAGPCIGAVSQEEYREIIAGLGSFLEGQTEAVLQELEAKMAAAAELLQFERAARYRDQIRTARGLVERQAVVSPALANQDVIAFARADGDTCVQVFFVRYGKMIGRETFVLEGTEGEENQEVMASFLKQFYNDAAYVPPEILLPHDVDEVRIIEAWLGSKRGANVVLRVPQNDNAQGLVKMAEENATETLNALRSQWQADTNRQLQALAELQEALGLNRPPARIECFDISNTQGTEPVASMVVFAQGVPRKSDYRRFQVKTVQGPDDYASMKEVLRRRFRRAVEEHPDAEKPGGQRESAKAWKVLPDLLMVDGGKGQLGVAVEVLQEYELLDAVPVVALAKEREELFLPGKPEPIFLPRTSQGLYLVQRVRDEAHRFALTYHRNRRARAARASMLEEIAGIGPVRRRALLRQFGSLEAIREAPVEELARVPGMTRTAAEHLKAQL
ncbi:MAG: excinuclease ABC subunit UvrC [Anaerolineae bacterium]|nr:excinuclease ABC subunit UvrC [Anaerolineae bacterium]